MTKLRRRILKGDIELFRVNEGYFAAGRLCFNFIQRPFHSREIFLHVIFASGIVIVRQDFYMQQNSGSR